MNNSKNTVFVEKRLEKLFYDHRWNILEKCALITTNGDPTFEKLRNKVFEKPARFLFRAGFSPNRLSVFGFLMSIIAATLLNSPLIASFFIIANMLADGFDGVVARLHGLDCDQGAIVDITCDTSSSIVLIVGFTWFYSIELAWSVAWIAVIIAYSFVSAIKSAAVIDIFRSLGSRITMGLGTLLILLLNAFGFITQTKVPIIFSYFISFISGCLLILLFGDLIKCFLNANKQ